ncbi:hypothetical protein GCM10027089_18950 [Nocardia thraciensis]
MITATNPRNREIRHDCHPESILRWETVPGTGCGRTHHASHPATLDGTFRAAGMDPGSAAINLADVVTSIAANVTYILHAWGLA